jgi:hypothetical protein
MLSTVKKLNESVTAEQLETLKTLLEEDQYDALETALRSKTEAEAEASVAVLREKLSNLGAFDFFQIGMILDSEQKSLIGAIAGL